jgi:PhnB protein
MTTFKDMNCSQDEKDDNLLMHSLLTGKNGITFMASDIPSNMEYEAGKNNFSMSLSGDDENLLRGYFEKLSVGGSITMPILESAWKDLFGMLTDKYGVAWFVNISAKEKEITSPKKEITSPRKGSEKPKSPKKTRDNDDPPKSPKKVKTVIE